MPPSGKIYQNVAMAVYQNKQMHISLKVLYYAALQLNTLEAKSKACNCHNSQCKLLTVLQCKINGMILSILAGMSTIFDTPD